MPISSTFVTATEGVNESFSRTILESSPDCLKLLDKQGRLQYMNFNGLCLMEIDDFGGFQNKLWWDLWGSEHREMVKTSVDKALNGEIAQFSAFCSTAKGTPKWWNVTVSPIISPLTQEVEQVLSVSRDITDIKEKEQAILSINEQLERMVKVRTEELEAKNAELQQLNSELATFNYIASHDLQEPLRKLQLFTGIILKGNNPYDETHATFQRILTTTEHMRSLINAMQVFTGVKNTKIQPEICHLSDIVAYVAENLRDQIIETQAELHIGSLPTVSGLRILLVQLFTNLLANSLRYAQPHLPPVIHITANKVSGAHLPAPAAFTNKAYWQITVKDNGIGFDNELGKQIFEFFQRLHVNDDVSGLGIGLTICKQIALKHGGFITAEGAVNVGATFRVYLPIATDEA